MGCFRLKESSGVIRALVCAAIVALGLSAWADNAVSDFDSLTNAIATVEEDSVIVVTASINLPATLVVNRKVTVRGNVTNPAAVVIDAGGKRRAVKITAAATVEGLTIKNGYVAGSNETGAGVQMTAGTLRNCIVSDCGFPSGQGQGTRGGGVYLSGANTLVEDCEIARNYGDLQTYGSGICNNGGTVRNCFIHSNTHKRAITNGVGLYQSGMAALTEGCIISNNVHSGIWSGNPRIAGALVDGGRVQTTLFIHNKLTNCNSTDGAKCAGAVMLGNATLANCTFVGNTSDSGQDCAGVYVKENAGVVENCLFSDNYNSNKKANDDVRSGTKGTWTSNVLADPSLVGGGSNMQIDAVPFKEVGFYELPDGATCLGQGTVETWMEGVTDTKGNLLLRTVGDATVVDVGWRAYEAPAIVVLISSDAEPLQFDRLTAQITSSVSGETDGLTYYWDFDGDGVADQVGKAVYDVTLDTEEFGDYPVRLHVTNDVGKAGVSAALTFKLRPRKMYLDPNGTNPVWPYATPETAATSIKDVYNAENIVAGMSVCISRAAGATEPTVVALDETLVLDMAGVTFCGGTGDPRDVVLDAGGNKRVVKIMADATLKDLTVRNGKLTGEASCGAGVYMEEGTLRNCIVTQCKMTGANGYGAGVYVKSQRAVVEDCEIFDNTAYRGTYGGGLCNDGATVRGCFIHDNHDTSGQGITYGLGFYQTGSAAMTDRCIISNNVASATWYGGETQIAGAQVAGGKVRNTLFVDNRFNTAGTSSKAPSAAGVALGAATLENCTIVGSRSKSSTVRAGVAVSSASAKITNCVFSDNFNDGLEANDDFAQGVSGTWNNNVMAEPTAVTGSGNTKINEHPFKDGCGYELSDDSACNGAGLVDMDWMADAKDLKGTDRLRVSSGSTVVDVGCYAYEPPAIIVIVASDDARVQLDHLSATVRATVSGETDGLVYYWDTNGDGSADVIGADRTEVTLADALGNFPVRLYVTNGVGKAATSAEIAFKSRPSTAYLDPNGTNPVWPYATPQTAATSAEDVISPETLVGGMTVVVRKSGDGPTVVQLDKTVVMDVANVTLRGETGDPRDVILDAGGNKRGVEITAAATVRDLTVRNGFRRGSNSTGAGVYMKHGTLKNCIVSGCVFENASSSSSFGCGIYVTGADSLVEGCEVFDNVGDLQIKGAGICNDGATVRACFVHDNKIPSNRAISMGLGLYQTGASARTERCVISNNVHTGTWTDNDRVAGVQVDGGCLVSSLIVSNRIAAANDKATAVAGVRMNGGKLVNCTVIGNTCNNGDSGGVRIGNAAAQVKNCIIWDNANSSGLSNWTGNDASFTYCCTMPQLTDEHSIAKDPKFKSRACVDGRLKGSSPCVHAGVYDTTCLDNDTLDLYGCKVVDEKGRVTMGCVRCDPTGLILFFK